MNQNIVTVTRTNVRPLHERVLSVFVALVMVITAVAVGIVPLDSVFLDASAAVTALTTFNFSAGATVSSGRYVVTASNTLTGSGGPGLKIADNSTVLLYIPSGVTLTVTGAAGGNAGAGGTAADCGGEHLRDPGNGGSGAGGGYAGIYLPSSSTLIVTGQGTLKATGGKGGNAGAGGKGGNSYACNNSGSNRDAYTGSGGGGGGGAGGGGAGIGTNGASGGAGGKGGAGFHKHRYLNGGDGDSTGNSGVGGSTGGSSAAGGNVYKLGSVTMTVAGGAAGSASSSGGGYGSRDNSGSGYPRACSAGGAGGGAGGAGTAGNNYGGGGSGGGGGGGGGAGGYWYSSKKSYGWRYAGYGGGGVSGGSNGTQDNSGDDEGNRSSGGTGGGQGTRAAAKSLLTTTPAYAQISVTLDQQGGSGGSSSVTATIGLAMPSATKPSRTGYTFGGYYSGTGGSGTQYYNDSCGSAHVWDGSAGTLYAKWTANNYSLTVAPNGGNWNGNTANTSYTQAYATTKDIPVPTRTGYSFMGWSGATVGAIGGLGVYNNQGNGKVVHTVVSNSDSAYGQVLQITTNGAASPGAGGFVQNTTSSANSVYIQTIVAKIPVGYTICDARNAIGNGGSSTWLTPRAGTGRWETYQLQINCGNGGTYSTFGHIYLTGSNNQSVTWYVASSEMRRTNNTPAVTGSWPQGRYTYPAANNTITAKWLVNKNTLTINPNGGTYNGSAANATVTQDYGTSYTPLTPVRTGYKFAGWSTTDKVNWNQAGSSVGSYGWGGSATVTWVDNNSTINSPGGGKVLQVVMGGTATNRRDGFVQSVTSAANTTFYHVFTAKVPVGYTVSQANNAVGNGSSFTWLTDRAGTGEWKTYAYKLTCGSSGTFSDFGYVWLALPSSNANTTFYVADSRIYRADGTILANTQGSYSFTANANQTITAKWTPIAYTVAYNGNGATGGSTASSSHTYGVAKNLTANGFTRAYTVTYNYNGSGAANTTATATYSFAGWNTNSGGTGANYSNSQSVSNLSSTDGATVTLYAKWNSASVTLPSATRVGYTFGGWYKEAACTNKAGDAGASYTPTAATTLYAKWTVNQYSVSYAQGTATGGTLPANQTANYGSTVTLGTNAMTKSETDDAVYTVTYDYNGSGEANSTATTYLKRTYTANGWTKTSDSQTRDYANGAQYTVPAGNVTLYPCFTQSTRYTSTTLPSPTREGYTFTGWYDGETRVGGAGDSYTPTGSVTLKAGWSANEYTVTLDQQGATTEGTLSVTATYDAAMPAITVPQRTGYAFGGFFSEANGAGTVYYDENGASANNWNRTADTTLFAYWVANPYYLHFEPNGGSGEMSNQKLTYDVEANITANAFEKTANVTYDYNGGVADKTGETVTLVFANWSANSDGSGDTYTDGQPVKNLASEKDAVINLYAQWNGVGVTLPATSRTGYDFAGWYAGDEKIEGDTYTVTGAVTLTAHWTAHTYTVAFDGNQGAGATPVTGDTASVTFTYDGEANILTSNGFERAGYDFLGWSLDSAAAAAAYTNGQTVTDNLTAADGASVTLYAVWSALEQTNNYSGATVSGASTFTGKTDSTVTLGNADDKTGYTFGGWYLTSDFAGDPVTSVLVPAGGATVYAKWTANEYTVTFVAATEAPGYTTEGTTSATATYDAAMPAITLPVRAGYSFGGFKTEGGELYYNADGSSARVYDIPGDTTLYAVWTADEDTAYTVKHYKQDLGADTYTLADTDELTGTSDTTVTAEVRSYAGFTAPDQTTVFIKPDGSAVLEYRYTRNSYTLTVVPAGDSFDGETSVTRQYDDTYVITAVPDKTGYIFNGWTKTAGEGSLDGNTYTFGAGDGTVTATYTPKAYTVRFNSNNGEDLTREQTLVYDKSAPLDRNSFSKSVTVSFAYNGGTGSPEQMTLDAFTFTGWNTAPDGSGAGYGDGAEVVNLSTGADVELYAQWTTTTIDMPETSRTGYDLDGWYEGENKVEGAYTVTGDVSFEARWTAHTYTVAFDGNRGAGATPVTGETASVAFTYDGEANILTSNGFARAGYEFLGWSTDPAATAADYTDSQTVADGLYAGKGATVTLYAVWQALEQTNNYDGATSGGAVTFTGETDSTVTLGEPDAKTGYTFGGWYRNAGLTDGPVTEITVPAGGARVYAKWTANRYAVTLGVGDEGLAYITPGTTDVTATYDADMPAITAPTRVGYQFAGYYTDDGVMYYDADGNSARTWDIDGEAELTARWIPDGDTKYKVEHYLEDLNADTYTLETYGIFGGESDTDVTPAVGSFTGFTAPAAQTVRIEPDGSTVVKYYYTRDSYTVKFLNYDGSLLSEKVYEYGDTVAEPAAPTKPSDSANHYFFSRWDPAVVTVDGDVTYKAEFTAHAHEWKSEVTVKPDGKNRGVRTYTCEDCGSSYREVIKSQFEDCPWCGQDHSGHGWIGEINWIFHMIFAMIRDIFNFASRG